MYNPFSYRKDILRIHAEVETKTRQIIKEVYPETILFDSFLPLQQEYAKLCKLSGKDYKVSWCEKLTSTNEHLLKYTGN